MSSGVTANPVTGINRFLIDRLAKPKHWVKKFSSDLQYYLFIKSYSRVLYSRLCKTSECCHSSQMNLPGSIHDESYTSTSNSVKKEKKCLCEKVNAEIIVS